MTWNHPRTCKKLFPWNHAVVSLARSVVVGAVILRCIFLLGHHYFFWDSSSSSSSLLAQPLSNATTTTSTRRTPVRLTYRAQTKGNHQIFRILQIADIHLGEEEATDWGPEQDRKTWIALDRILRAELSSSSSSQHTSREGSCIDLIVLTGDQLTANNVDTNATAYYQRLARQLSSQYGIPFAMIFGNHDDQPLEYRDTNTNQTKTMPKAKTSRRQLVQSLAPFDLSLTQAGPIEVFGVSNYWLEIFLSPPNNTPPSSSSSSVATRIVLLDSGGGMLPEQITQSQLEWFTAQNNKNNNAAQHRRVPVMAFVHIPAIQFTYTTHPRTSSDVKACYGDHFEGSSLATLQADAGLVPTLQQAGNVHVLAAGHMHGNSYCCRSSTSHRDDNSSSSSLLHLCFGRHSGYGGYGHWERGARVYELQMTTTAATVNATTTTTTTTPNAWQFSWSSYVRLESGGIQDVYVPAAG